MFHCQPGFTPPFDYGALVVTLHDVIPLLMPPEVFGKERCDEYRAHLTALARAATLLICGSRAAADTVAPTLGFPRERVRIVPYAPDPRFSRAPAPEERAALRAHLNLPGPYVLALGTRSPHKNHVRLIRGFAAIAPEVPHHLVIAGGWGLSAEEIGRTIEETGLGERVRIVEYAPDEHLPALFAEADLFVQPSLHEGFGLPLADAMLAGVPVACSASSCMPEVAGEAARYFDPLDCTSIADALSAVLRHPERRAELSTASRTQAAIFSWEKTARMTLAVYEEASGGVKSEK